MGLFDPGGLGARAIKRVQPAMQAVFRRLFKHDLIILPAPHPMPILPMNYTYRLEDGRAKHHVLEGPGKLQYTLKCWPEEVAPDMAVSFSTPVPLGASLEVDVLNSEAWLDGRPVPVVGQLPNATRKFVAHFTFSTPTGTSFRSCFHYLPGESEVDDERYFFGENYIDYDQQAKDLALVAARQVSAYRSSGRLLDVGCALGVYMETFQSIGFDVYGVDASRYVVEEASKRVGVERVAVCNVGEQEIPFGFKFDVIWMSSIFEHFDNPRMVLRKLRQKAAPGAYLFISTVHSKSLSHIIFGRDWEGFVDPTHNGIEKISAADLRKWVQEDGWEILELTFRQLWVKSVDPVYRHLHQLFQVVPELRVFLQETELGDGVWLVVHLPEEEE